MITSGASILGRGTVIGFGTASLFLLSTPIGVSGKFQAKYSCYICSYSNMFPWDFAWDWVGFFNLEFFKSLDYIND